MALTKGSKTGEEATGVEILLTEHLTPRRQELDRKIAAKRAELAARTSQIDLLAEGDALQVGSDEAELARLEAPSAEQEDGLAGLEGKQKPPARGLVAHRHQQRDFFLADLFDYTIKGDRASMEVPIFSLSTKPDRSVWRWQSQRGDRFVEVVPSVLGRATQHDKDVLIFVISQMTEAIKRGREDAQNRTVRFTVHDMLVTTNRGTGGDDYLRLTQAFERLAGTRIKTDIKTGGRRVIEGFGLIESFKVVSKAQGDDRMAAVEITLSEWLFNAIHAHKHKDVLTIHPDYFRLRKPLARRLYELARKHCGSQPQKPLKLSTLLSKTGSRGTAYELLDALRKIAADDSLPEYRVTIFAKRGRVNDTLVTFTQRGNKAAVRAALSQLQIDTGEV